MLQVTPHKMDDGASGSEQTHNICRRRGGNRLFQRRCATVNVTLTTAAGRAVPALIIHSTGGASAHL